METAFFYLFGGIALLSAISVVVQKRVFYSAISLIVCLCSVAVLYLALEAPFIAAVQIIVYAGAIMVLFLFVIMLLDPFSAAILKDKKKYLAYLAVLLGALTIGASAAVSEIVQRGPRSAACGILYRRGRHRKTSGAGSVQ